MRTHYNPKNNPRVIIIQKLYGKFYNEDDDLDFPKHRFKKFIKDLKIKNMILITKSPKKVIGLDGYGIKITKQELIWWKKNI